MTAVRVLLPVLKGKIFFVVDKGRHWSVLEHLLLEALAKQNWSADALAQASGIPKRVVVEALVRLMRAGWVELAVEEAQVRFRATAIGGTAANKAELPRLEDIRKRPTNYILDTVCGEIFRNKEVLTQSEDEAKKSTAKDVPSVWIEPDSWQTQVDINEALEVLLDNDEAFISGQPGGVFRKWIPVLVRDGVIVSGLPEGRALTGLRAAIVRAADTAAKSEVARLPAHDVYEGSDELIDAPESIDSVWISSDLILGGSRHREVLEWILDEARSQVFIHSTFINQARVEALLEKLAAAIERGVKVQIFWGQNEDRDGRSTTRQAIEMLRKNLEVQRLADNLIFHPNSTGSHAKLMVADAGIGGEYVAVVGSCNWLTSGFDSYEVSVVLREATAVRAVVGCLSKLVCMHDGVWSELASEFARIGQNIHSSQKVFVKRDAKVSLVLGGQHNQYVLRARDEADRRIILASHRLGAASRPGILTPLSRAAKERETEVHVFYCRRTAPVRTRDEKQIVEEAVEGGVEVELIVSPRLHAKFLLWDDDHALITSLNWLSADQVDIHGLGEIGIYVNAPGVAVEIAKHFANEVANA